MSIIIQDPRSKTRCSSKTHKIVSPRHAQELFRKRKKLLLWRNRYFNPQFIYDFISSWGGNSSPSFQPDRKICEENSIWKCLCTAILIRIRFIFHAITHLNWLFSARLNIIEQHEQSANQIQSIFGGLFAWSYLWPKYTCVMCIKWAKISYARTKNVRKETEKENEKTTRTLATPKMTDSKNGIIIERLNLLYFILFYFIIYNCVVCTICVWVCTHALIISKVNA